MLAIIIDIVLVLVLVFAVWRGISKGFILSVIGLVAMIAVFFGARYLAENYSDKISDVIAPLVSSSVTEAVTNERVEQGLEYEQEDESTLKDAALSIFSKMGVYYNAREKLAQSAVEESGEKEYSFRDAVKNSFVDTLAYAFVFIISYLLLNIIVSVILNLCNVVFKLPGLHLLNTIGGGIAGLIIGLLVVFAAAWVLRYAGFIGKGDLINSTKVLKFFAENNPFNILLSI